MLVATFYSLIIYLSKHYILMYCSLHFGTGNDASILSPTFKATLQDCQCFALSSSVGTLPKAFQTNTTCSFGFFIAPQFTKASFRRCVATKKPPICMGGFVERTGIEPVLPGWKPEVLTVRRTLQGQMCYSGRKNKARRFLAQIFLIYILKKRGYFCYSA